MTIIKNHFEVFILTSKSKEIALSSQKLGYIPIIKASSHIFVVNYMSVMAKIPCPE
jgi:hypothetical protein